jgi:hypothetical protein
MGRSVVAVIVAYISMFILNFLAFVGLYALVGPAHAFKPASYLASNRWIAMSFVAILITAIIAGLICAAIARGGRAPLALVIVILVVGLVLGIPAVMKHRANEHMVRVGDVPSMEAAQKAYWPVWAPFVFPFISAAGVLVGARLKQRR